jgi:hypothetical protein
MAEPPDPRDLILRTVAVKLVCIAMQCDGVGGESYLVEYMSRRPASESRYRLWDTQIVAAVQGARVDPLSYAEFARTMQIHLWRETHAPRDGAIIHVRGNELTYRGPLLRPIPAGYEIRRLPKGLILNSLILVDPRRLAEIRVGAVRLPLAPLVEALRRDDGLADLALAQLREEGLLPAGSSSSPSSQPEAKAPIAASPPPAARVDDGPPKDGRRSRKRALRAGTKSVRASAVLRRIYQDRLPNRDEVSDADLWNAFVEEWARVEGVKRHSLNDRPQRSTVMRAIGRKD